MSQKSNRSRRTLSRRAFLGSAVSLPAIAGCTSTDSAPSTSDSTQEQPSPDDGTATPTATPTPSNEYAEPSVGSFFPADPDLSGSETDDPFTPVINNYDLLATREVDWEHSSQPRSEEWRSSTQDLLDRWSLGLTTDQLVGDIRYQGSHSVLYGDIDAGVVSDEIHGSTMFDGDVTFSGRERIGGYRLMTGYKSDSTPEVPVLVGPQVVVFPTGTGQKAYDHMKSIATAAVNRDGSSRYGDIHPRAGQLLAEEPRAATVTYRFPRTDHEHSLDTLDRQSAFTFKTDTYDSEWYLHRSSTYVLASASAAATTRDAVSDSEFRDDLNLAVPGETDITVDENRIIVTGAFPPNRLWAVSNGSV